VISNHPDQHRDGPHFQWKSAGRFGGFLDRGSPEGRPQDAEPTGRLALGQAGHCGEPSRIDPASRSTEPHTVRFGALQASQHAFSDAFPFELRVGPENVHLQLPAVRLSHP
jgi:hypothetical protein